MVAVAAIILAAGASQRMGQPKQLLDWHGQPLIRAIAQAALASQARPVSVVLGGASAAVAEALHGLPLAVVKNPHYASGQSSSLRAGIAALGAEVPAALVLLGDQPFVTPAIIDTLIAAWCEQRSPIIAPTFGGQRGHPVLFDRSMFGELLAVEGDQGARSMMAAKPERIRVLAFANQQALIDIDTQAEYERAKQQGL